ncbi:uncharacterized protein L201_001315 [Kwoniella dendrophila CBS 6074]|uniref:Uncharacterized protein n=1 Tax=Kwoniella dendrophila CBS 6074 TaxID=1295534 RepID=A0AAX4JNJ5_9TREE
MASGSDNDRSHRRSRRHSSRPSGSGHESEIQRSSGDGRERSSHGDRERRHRSGHGERSHRSDRHGRNHKSHRRGERGSSGNGDRQHRSSGHGENSRKSSKSHRETPKSVESDGSRAGEMAKYSGYFRYYILYTSGGWLGNLLMWLSDSSGIWEFTFLSILFVISWTILRMGQIEITLILGHIFDLIIPLQHQFNPTKQSTHANHLDQYWPLFFIGSIVEFSCFILVHPDLFTLVACLKTLVLTSIWLGRDSKGNFMTEKFGGNKRGTVNRHSDGSDPRQHRWGDQDGHRSNGRNDSHRSGDGDGVGGWGNRHQGGRKDESNGDGGNSSNGNNANQGTEGDTSTKGNSNNNNNAASTSANKDETSAPANKKTTDSNEKVNDSSKNGKGRHPYDSRGFRGDLMPITKQVPDAPTKGPRQG